MISVIIPIYNVENLLCHCLDSLQAQTFKDFEAILIDDGATDRSGAICDDYCLKDNRFKVIHKGNEGIAAARNEGLRLATGDFIFFMDSDDYIHPQTLEIMVSSLLENKEADFSMIYGKKTYHYDDIVKDSFKDYSKNVISYGQEDMIRGLFGTSDQEIQYQVIWNKLFRSSLIKDIQFKDIVAEDVEFIMRVYLKTKRVVLFPFELYYYYQHPNSITHQDTNANNQIVRERFIHNLDTYYQIYTYIPKEQVQYQAWCLWKLYKRIFNVRYYSYTTSFKEKAKSTISDIKGKTWEATMNNPMIPSSQKWIIRLLYYFPILYKLMMWKNRLSIN